MDIHLIGVHYNKQNKDSVVAFRLLDADNGQVLDKSYRDVFNVLKSNKAIIHGLVIDNNSLKGNNGALSRYPKIVDGIITEPGIIIIATIDDVGYRISDVTGKLLDTTTDRLFDYMEAWKINSIANGKIVTKGNTKYISSISGKYGNIPLENVESINKLIKIQKADKQYAQEIKETVKKYQSGAGLPRASDPRLPRAITGVGANPSKLKEIDNNTGMTVEQKMAYTLVALRNTRPFYYSILNVLKRIEANEADGIPTMAVSLDSLYFSSDFVKELTLPELLFVVIHEICHIGMKHRAREHGKEHDIWNVACDYYINKCIAQEFGLKEPGDIACIDSNISSIGANSYKIALPLQVLYNPSISVEKDTPEKIYEELSEIIQKSKNNAQGGGNSSDGQEGQEEQGKGGANSYGGSNSDGDGDSNSDSDNGSNNNNNSGGSTSKDRQGNKNNREEQRKPGRLIGKEFRGKRIKDYSTDIVDDKNTKGKSPEQINQSSTSILKRAVVVHRQTNSFGGDTADFLERYVEMAIAPKINWRSLLKNKLTLATKKVNTFSAPDKRFRSRGMIIPGPKVLDNDALDNVKICIDTSGSISPKDLGIALNQVEQLLKVYKAKAEVLYWDTRVRAIYPFKDVKELLSKEPKGGGGTDVNCVFDYFETDKDYKLGRKPKPQLILIFTDGYFGAVDKQFSKYRDTIWIVQGNNSFEPPFGTKAPFKVED